MYTDDTAEFNKDEQEQIQAVFANVETVQPGYWFNPFGHSLQVRPPLTKYTLFQGPLLILQVRCDDPVSNCRGGVTAYTVNPKANEKPYVNFCPGFFRQYTLDYAVKNYKDHKNAEIKWNVDNYQNRGIL